MTPPPETPHARICRVLKEAGAVTSFGQGNLILERDLTTFLGNDMHSHYTRIAAQAASEYVCTLEEITALHIFGYTCATTHYNKELCAVSLEHLLNNGISIHTIWHALLGKSRYTILPLIAVSCGVRGVAHMRSVGLGDHCAHVIAILASTEAAPLQMHGRYLAHSVFASDSRFDTVRIKTSEGKWRYAAFSAEEELLVYLEIVRGLFTENGVFLGRVDETTVARVRVFIQSGFVGAQPAYK